MYNPAMVTRLIVLLAALVSLGGCSSRDVEKDLQIVNVRTGWYDVGVVEGGQNKLVPSISFQLKNVSQEDISGVQLNAVFRDVKEDGIIGEHFVPAIGSDRSLRAGATTNPIVLRSKVGFTGTETRAQMLRNSRFVDARVMILGRHGRKNWVRMAQFQLERQLLTE